jgi:hypothetical protein
MVPFPTAGGREDPAAAAGCCRATRSSAIQRREHSDPGIVVDAGRNAFNPGTDVEVDGFRRMLAEMDDV